MNGLSFIRRRCNLSQGQLAEKLDVTRQAINLWENRRAPLPEMRRNQLSDFFGLEPEYFDEITQEQKNKLLARPCFMYRDADGHDYFLFRENPQRPIGCLLHEKTGEPYTQEEQMVLDRRELEEMLQVLRQSVFPKDRPGWTAWDSNIAMNRIRNILGGLTNALEAIEKQPKEQKMNCFYLVMQVELALALALDGISAEDLPPQKESDPDGLDTAYITELAENFQNWLRKRNAQINSALAKSDSARYNDSRRER